jgi:hypothetical protein
MIKTTLIACALVSGITFTAEASGSYVPPTGRVPSNRISNTDSNLYALGQKTFEGKMMSAGAGDVNSQKSKLMSLQSKIPVNSGTDLTKYAGKITDEQLKALEYYISKRFGV